MCCTDVHVLYVYTTDVHVLYERCICVVWIFPRKNARSKNLRTRPQTRSKRGHGCFISPRPGDTKCSAQERAPQLRGFSRIAARKPIFCVHWPPHQGITWDCGETERSILQGLASPWDTIPANAQDATKQRGAETTEQEACLGIKRVRKHNYGKGTRKNVDSDPPTHTQPTQEHNSDTTESQERGRNDHHPYPRPQHGTANARQDSGYSNSSMYTLYTAEILQPANGCRKEEARATTLCMAWHALQEVSSCATIPIESSQRGHSASTTSVASGGVAM